MTPHLDGVSQQLDDMRRLLGTVIGQNSDILNEATRRRSFEVELSPRAPGLRRIEDLLRRALLHLGDSEIAAELGRESRPHDVYPESSTPSEESFNNDASMFAGTEGMYSGDFNPKARAPPNSFTDSIDPRRRRRFSAVPDSLLRGEITTPDFDEGFAMRDLPPQTPPAEYVIPHAQVPPQIASRRRPPRAQRYDEQPEEEYSEFSSNPEEEQDQTPVPYRQDEQYDQGLSEYGDEQGERRPTRPLPPPQPVDLPTPVRTPETYPPQGPSYPAGGMLPPPGMAGMPRPSLPRIAGVRDPISTT